MLFGENDIDIFLIWESSLSSSVTYQFCNLKLFACGQLTVEIYETFELIESILKFGIDVLTGFQYHHEEFCCACRQEKFLPIATCFCCLFLNIRFYLQHVRIRYFVMKFCDFCSILSLL